MLINWPLISQSNNYDEEWPLQWGNTKQLYYVPSVNSLSMIYIMLLINKVLSFICFFLWMTRQNTCTVYVPVDFTTSDYVIIIINKGSHLFNEKLSLWTAEIKSALIIEF